MATNVRNALTNLLAVDYQRTHSKLSYCWHIFIRMILILTLLCADGGYAIESIDNRYIHSFRDTISDGPYHSKRVVNLCNFNKIDKIEPLTMNVWMNVRINNITLNSSLFYELMIIKELA